jgi:hypothetical protein
MFNSCSFALVTCNQQDYLRRMISPWIALAVIFFRNGNFPGSRNFDSYLINNILIWHIGL